MPLQANLKSVAQEREADSPGGGWPYMEQHHQTRPDGTAGYGIVNDGGDQVPFESEAQRRWMYANKPEMAARWQKETPKGKKLPKHVKKESGLLATMRFDKEAGRVTDALGSIGVGLRKATGGVLKGLGHLTSGVGSGAALALGNRFPGIADVPADALKRVGEAVTPKPKPKSVTQPQPPMHGGAGGDINGVQDGKVVTAADIHNYLVGELTKEGIDDMTALALTAGIPLAAGGAALGAGIGIPAALKSAPARPGAMAQGLQGKPRGKIRRAFEHLADPSNASSYYRGQELRAGMGAPKAEEAAGKLMKQHGMGSKLLRAMRLAASPLSVGAAPITAPMNALKRLFNRMSFDSSMAGRSTPMEQIMLGMFGGVPTVPSEAYMGKEMQGLFGGKQRHMDEMRAKYKKQRAGA